MSLNFLLFTGCRPSEAFGLAWDNVDLENGTVSIERTLCRVRGSWSFELTKTEEAERTIQLTSDLAEMLSEHRAAVGERRLQAGSAWQNHGLVFPGPMGEPLDISAVRRRHFNKICAKAGLAEVEELPARVRTGKRGPKPKPRLRIKPWFSLYSLRHTSASVMSTGGVPVEAVKGVLGHADVTTTLRHYIHSNPDLEASAVSKLAELVRTRRTGPK